MFISISNKRILTLFVFILWLLNSIFLIVTLYLQQKEKLYNKKIQTTLYAKLPFKPLKLQIKNIDKKVVRTPKRIKLKSSTKLKTGRGTKSVIFDSDKKYLYAMNLEGMSIQVFDRQEKSLLKTLKFKPTKAKGYDYQTNKWFDSYAEKPVEACLTHQDRYLWISLHNAGGVVVWDLYNKQEIIGTEKIYADFTDLKADTTYQIQLPFIKTGKTPKFITGTSDNQYVFISNWHDHTVSVIDTRSDNILDWKIKKQLKANGVPRGLALSADETKLYVAHMGKGFISVFNTDTFELESKKYIGATPRHIIADEKYLYVSLSSPEKIVKLTQDSLKLINTANTLDDPRTITFGNDSNFVVTTCYADDKIQIFGKDSFNLFGSWESKGKPVGVDVYQRGNIIETWVCNYINGNIKVFTFEAEFEDI